MTILKTRDITRILYKKVEEIMTGEGSDTYRLLIHCELDELESHSICKKVTDLYNRRKHRKGYLRHAIDRSSWSLLDGLCVHRSKAIYITVVRIDNDPYVTLNTVREDKELPQLFTEEAVYDGQSCVRLMTA